jgi:hypothetical protein
MDQKDQACTPELKLYQSKYYHNEHSHQRDRFLVKNFGEEWLKDMKSKGFFGGDFPDEIIGTLKEGDWRSRDYDASGNEFKCFEEVDLDASNN